MRKNTSKQSEEEEKEIINIFIDTNIFLGFYALSNADLEQLKKLVVLIKSAEIKLILPQQVIDEFERNRDNQIANGMKFLKDGKLERQFPNFCKEYEEYNKMKNAITEYEKNKTLLLNKLQMDIEKEALKADKIISKLFDLGTIVEITDEILEQAIDRYDRGNPPGKDKSYGDSINWICLLDSLSDGEDIYIITDDSDYASAIDRTKIKPFLEKEWSLMKGSDIYFYKTLSDFFNQKFEHIILADEYEKEQLIKYLISSPTFRATHAVIRDLRKFSSFSITQVSDIIRGAIDNPQIRWIGDDSDVSNFLTRIIETYKEEIDTKLLEEFYDTYNDEESF